MPRSCRDGPAGRLLEFLHFGRHDPIVFLWVPVWRPAPAAKSAGETFSTNSENNS